MKKLCVLTLSLFLLCACQTNTTILPTPPKTSNEITILVPDSSLIPQTLGQITQIRDNYVDALKIKLASSDPPTLFYLNDPSLIGDFTSFLEDLSHEEWVDNLYPNTISYLSIDGRVVAMPSSFEGYGFVYNGKIFNLAGIDSKNINSPSRFADAVSILEKRIQNGDFLKEYPHLKTAFSKDLIDLAENRAAITFSSNIKCESLYNTNPETASSLRLLPIYTNTVDSKIALAINGVWCINKNAPENEKRTAKKALESIYPIQSKSFALQKDVIDYFNSAKTLLLKSEKEMSILYEEILDVFSKINQ
jgi:hypothetical protein